MRFRSKPVEIDAIQITKEVAQAYTHDAIKMPDAFGMECSSDEGFVPTCRTLEGEMRGRLGDWLITGTEGEHYLCKDSVFQKKYEPMPTMLERGVIEAEFSVTPTTPTDSINVSILVEPPKE